MSRQKFHPDDIFINRVKAHPQFFFTIYQGELTINGRQNLSGALSNNVLGVPKNYISLYEYNIDRGPEVLTNGTSSHIHPFVINGGLDYKHTFRKNLNGVYGHRVLYGDNNTCNTNFTASTPGAIESGTYNMSASITRIFACAGDKILYADDRFHCTTTSSMTSNNNTHPGDEVNEMLYINLYASSLQNVARKYTPMSKHFVFTPTGSTLDNGSGATLYTSNNPVDSTVGSPGAAMGHYGMNGGGNFLERDLLHSCLNIINVPSIMCGSGIKKGSVKLRYYITGGLIAECADIRQNGELIETTGSQAGEVIGICMYNEGLIILTSSVAITNNNIEYVSGTPSENSWLYYGTTCNDGTGSSDTLASASYDLAFDGTSYTSTMTLLCHAHKGRLNYSNNPTYVDLNVASASMETCTTSSYSYSEPQLPVKNVVSSSFKGYESELKKTVYISKIGIYDEKDNLIGIASLARPIKKSEEDDYTFKLTYDI